MRTTLRKSGMLSFAFCALAMIGLSLSRPAEVRAQWTTADANGHITNTNSGNVGVGTTAAPAYKLDVLSSSNVVVRFKSTSGHTQALIDSASSYNANVTFQHAGVSKWFLGNRASDNRFSLTEASGTMDVFSIQQNGNVGIGLTSPAARLHVVSDGLSDGRMFIDSYGSLPGVVSRYAGGTAASPSAITTSSTIAYFGGRGYGATGFSGGRASMSMTATENWTDSAQGTQIAFTSTTTGTTSTVARLVINGSGNIGIGTGTPTTLLDVAGQVRSSTGGFKFPDGTVQTTASDSGSSQAIFKNIADAAGTTQFSASSNSDALRFEGAGGTSVSFNSGSKKVTITGAGSSGWTDGGANINLTNSSSKVGIGTSSPATKLHIVSGTDTGTALLTLDTGVHGGTKMAVAGTANNESGFDMSVYRSGVYVSRLGVNETGSVYLQAGSGNVGVGTSTPNSSYKLDVNGNTNITGSLNVTGNINAKYQDVAEWVQSSQQLSPGTVVVLDQTKSNQVIASWQAYDTRVAGVISLQPGIALGESGAGKVLVATTGRVKVKVDASAGPIRVGDLLVTSEKEGVAKKSEPLDLKGFQIHRPGTLIGKALEPLNQGTGEILVLLSLQ
jgi:hypothetical protein